MSRAFEIKPLVAAMLAGALALWLLHGRQRQDLLAGAGVGAAVQVSVRLLGVS